MGQLLSYSLSVCIVLIPLCLTVRYLLGGTTFHRLTRAVIVASLLASLVMPFAATSIHDALLSIKTADVPSAMVASAGVEAEVAFPAYGFIADADYDEGSPWWLRVAVVVYIAGLSLFVIREVIGIIKLGSILINSEYVSDFEEWRIRVSDCGPIGPFSFGRYIVMSREDYESLDMSVLIHESAHLAGHHWADLILADIVTAICWYCPASWIMRRELAIVHEYEADEAVIRSGADAADYQIMLIKKAAGSRFPSIACNLTYHSNISKRIKMMLKKKSRPAMRYAAAAALPVMALGLMALTIPDVADALDRVSDVKVTNNNRVVQAPMALDQGRRMKFI